MEEATDGLRKAAPGWSLAGDRQLLDLLQDMHQTILEKCQETNKQLDCMVSALDDVSVTLQNVNNKFAALSNAQFVESRVYDDDVTESPAPEPAKEQSTPLPELDIDSANESLLVLGRMHETITILCDSGSGSGSDSGEERGSVVLKPKDLYAARPLPYIIGSQQWKSKWHAGLIREDSDVESDDECDKEVHVQYSETESESERTSPAMSSYSVDSHNQHSEMAYGSNPAPATMEVPKTQSDIAAELARRLGASAKVPAVEPDDPEPQPVPRKLYKPHQPAPGNIFSDEPPPLEDDQSEESDHDIFAEIYKTSSNAHGDKDHVSVADDLFGKPILDEQVPPTYAFEKPVINKELSKPINNTPSERESVEKEDISHKKPIGGKSLFGSNANSESIGAAILKRKSRQSSTSGDESDQEQPKMATPIKTVHKNNVNVSSEDHGEFQNKKRDIFDELFAKSERVNKEIDRKQKKETVKKEIKTPEKIIKKVDLFSDDIFDDIDDIFTNNASKNVIEKAVKEKTPSKSIFDDEDDDLFSDVAINKKPAKNEEIKRVVDNKRDIFNPKQKEATVTQVDKDIGKDSNFIKESKGLFDDSDDDLFTDFNKPKNTKPEQSKPKMETDDLFSDDNQLFVSKSQASETKKVTPKLIIDKTEPNYSSDIKTKEFVQSPDFFDDDISETMSPKHDTTIEITKNTLLPYVSTTKQNEYTPTVGNIVKEDAKVKPNVESSKTDKNTEKRAFNKEPVLLKADIKRKMFDDDSEDDLFGKPVKFDTVVTKNQTLRESHITKDPLENVSDDVIDIADKRVTSKQSDDIKQAVNDESRISVNSHTVNTEVISENVSENVNVTLSKPEIPVKPSVNVNIQTDVPQSKDKTNSMKITEKIQDQKDASPDIFPDETKSPFASSIPLPESKTDAGIDSFTDIFNDQPPDFEKPKEPKKSKNVNALFDDDSDDESLFFKKNDVITEDPPEEFTTNDDRLFGLFIDEPPAIDVDFVQKLNKIEKVESKTTKSENNTSDIIKSKIFDADAELFAPKIDLDKPNQITDKFKEPDDFENSFSSETSSKESKTSEIKNIFETDAAQSQTQDTLDSPQESKKIGKLKPMNFNINVNTLLPGASPKKTAKKDVKDNDNASVQSIDKGCEITTKEVDIPDNTATTLVKSASFEGEPDSAVLNNKLSKERAKIQVKRRPSTRRARREAVKISGIDFGEDSTDNSTSIDDSKSEKTDAVDEKTGTSQIEEKVVINKQEHDAQSLIEKQTTTNAKNAKEVILDRTEKKDSTSEINYLPDSTGSVQEFPDSISTVTEVAKNDKVTDTKIQSNQKTEIKSKVVYVLNDDDIFNTSALKNDPGEQKKSIFDDFNDENDIFKTISASKEKKTDRNLNQPTTAAKSNEPMNKSEIFSDDSDSDDLFKKTSKPGVTIEKTKSENILTSKSGKVEGPFKTLSSSGSIQTTNINTKTSEYEETKDLPKKIAKPASDTRKPGKILLSDSDDEALFKTIPASTQTKDDHFKDTFKTVEPKDTLIKPKIDARISDDKEENLFRNMPKSVASQDTKTKNKTSIFDTDDDLFKNSSKKVEKDSKASLFGSDSDDELFSGNKKEPREKKDIVFEKRKEVMKVDKKMSLFGDEGDEDDLFGAKKKTAEPKPRISSRDAPKDTSTVKTKAVLEDPLSMFGDED